MYNKTWKVIDKGDRLVIKPKNKKTLTEQQKQIKAKNEYEKAFFDALIKPKIEKEKEDATRDNFIFMG